ncbi:MAG TPA: FAD-dependent oxidoreductase [Gemmatimonadaceae bacterium]|nr:FAD-dependent oxidoreductase [Gemmatimonadaceae bacterium]
MADHVQLRGPDLSAGIAADSLSDGESLLGHAQGEAVLLARRGDEIFAISATCTHYGGPLADGAIDGEQVRCPWHHACFSIRTGVALRSPALSPVACWTVERRRERIRITGKVESDPLAPNYPIHVNHQIAPGRVVIVGAGAAGSAAAEMLRRCGYEGRVTMIDDDTASPYDRPNLSKDYLAGNAPEEWIPLRPGGFYAEHQIDIVRGRVEAIDPRRKKVSVSGHDSIEYGALLLATGAEPIRLDVPGIDQPHVHTLRSLADSRAIIEAAKRAKHAVVVGGSFIGLETAASLRARNVEVHVVAPEALPLARVLGDHLGNFIKSLHESKGVVFHLGRKPARIDDTLVILDDGTRLSADLVVVGAGVRPRLALAEQAGLALDRGVIVDGYLETSVRGIHAAGDIARWPDHHTGDRIRVEHWVVAQRQGQAAARNILGAREPFAQAPFFWSAHYDISINYVGHAEKWDRIEVDGDASTHDVTVRFMRGDTALAVATIFRDQESLNAEKAMER